MKEASRGLVLAVEDEPRNNALLRAILTPAGYTIAISETLVGAREWLAGHKPDVILLDRHLPDGDGLELARELKAARETQGIPIVLVSASVLPVDQSAAEEAGCDAFVMKPVRVRLLLDELARLVAASRSVR
jgi:two-component system, cell cycle response regulator DivK